MSGFVYAIQSVEGGPVKVGWSENVERRLAQIQGSHHSELKIVRSFPTIQSHEEEIHDALSGWRLRGEWFEDTPALWHLLTEAEEEGLLRIIATRAERAIRSALNDVAMSVVRTQASALDDADRAFITNEFEKAAVSLADALDSMRDEAIDFARGRVEALA